jgi:threonine synthase
MITLGEGDTPLVKSNRLGRELGCSELYFKLEGCNPTGSFKDRGMVVAIAKALEEGSKAVMCASTGNTSASAAAYAAYCDLPALVLIPKGEVAMGKLAQAMAYGARIIMVSGNFDVALKLVQAFTSKHPMTLVNSVNPHRIEGQKTAAFEVADALGEAPDYLFIPVGNAGNITAYWKGFKEYYGLGRTRRLPSMMGFQAEGAAPIVRGAPVANPQTIASAIRIGNPASWKGALDARDGSGGVIDMVSDDEILDAYRLLASREGVFCEPASAASFAGLVKMHRKGLDLTGKTVVCIFTGTGLKDPDLAVSSVAARTTEVEPTMEAVEAVALAAAL